jgi:hypothetical protein
MRHVAVIDVQTEQDIPQGGGWTYHVVVRHEAHNGSAARTTEHDVRLAWVDHDHWSGGRCPPSRVVERLFELLVERQTLRSIPARFDAATARRWFPELDHELTSRI